jgi:hypothetical protein
MESTSSDSQHCQSQMVAEIYHLGTLRREFAPDTWMEMGILGMFFIGCLFAISYGTYHIYSTSSSDYIGLFVILICFGPFPLFFLIKLIVIYRRRNSRIFVYEHGLLAVRNNSVDAVRWEEIVSVWYRVRRSRHGRYGDTRPSILQRRDSSTLKLGSFSSNEELGNMIAQETADLLFPETLATYQQGQPLSFGPFTLDQSGLTYKRKSLSWNEVTNIQFANGFISIKKQGKFFAWTKVAYEAIPNLRVFQRLTTLILDRRRFWTDDPRN